MKQANSHLLSIALLIVCLGATACSGTSGGDDAQTSTVEVDENPGWPETRPPPDPWSTFSQNAPMDVPIVETQATGDDQLRMMFNDSVEFAATDPSAARPGLCQLVRTGCC